MEGTNKPKEHMETYWYVLALTEVYLNQKRIDVCKHTVKVSLGGLGIMCSPQDSRFAGLNRLKLMDFFQDVKILSTSPLEGTWSLGSRVWNFRLVKEPQAWKNRPLSKTLIGVFTS